MLSSPPTYRGRFLDIFLSASTTSRIQLSHFISLQSVLSIALPVKMRALDETETRTMFTKLASYTGASLSNLIAPPAEGSATTERMVFRLVKDRVFYLPERIANFATSIPRDSLLTAGTMIGKFTKTGKFRLNMSSLSIIAPHARVKCWVKSNGE